FVESHKVEGGGREHIGDVQAFFSVLAFGENFLVVETGPWIKAPEMIGVIIVRMDLIEITHELIEAFLLRHTGGVLFAQTPLAYHGGAIAGLFEELGDGEVVR